MGHDLRTGLDEGDVYVEDVEEREEEADTNDPNEQVGERPDGDTVLACDHASAAARGARDGGGEAACFGCHAMLALSLDRCYQRNCLASHRQVPVRIGVLSYTGCILMTVAAQAGLL